jgi:hypothetical protein
MLCVSESLRMRDVKNGQKRNEIIFETGEIIFKEMVCKNIGKDFFERRQFYLHAYLQLASFFIEVVNKTSDNVRKLKEKVVSM